MLLHDFIQNLIRIEEVSEDFPKVYYDDTNKCLVVVDDTYESCRVTLPELPSELRTKIDD